MKNRRSEIAGAGGAMGLSALSSFIGLCCIGPWAVAVLGVPGAVALARWAPYRPWILAAAAVFLAWAFWRVYRPRPHCADGTCPPRPPAWLQAVLWLSALLLVLAIFAEPLQWLIVDPTPEAFR